MKAKTRYFGEIDIADEKIITLQKGMIGFPELTHYALIFDEEKEEDEHAIMWFQSMDDGDIAFPVMNPKVVKPDYAPTVTSDVQDTIGDLEESNTFILVTVSVPQRVEDFSVNLKAPIIVNTDSQSGVQVIVEDNYPIKYKVYELLKKKKEGAGE